MSKKVYAVLETFYAFKRQKYIIYATTAIFLISFILSYYMIRYNIMGFEDFGNTIFQSLAPQFEQFRNMGFIDLTIAIIINNLFVIFLNLVLTIFSLIILVFNSFVLAYVASISDLPTFLLLVVPHGIFEIPGFILSSSAGIIVFIGILRWIKDSKFHKIYLQDALRIFVVSVILIIVAGIIEGTVTFSIAKSIV
ncbi:stage II sporulation protein M [Methanococcus voltae]|uniref:Membrane protein SpoIIM required for sporulation n=2 Tax=Methanococcus voltae TaxID=2188 RepID=A0ABT2EU85_METVO|nr:stage II sporulation protein M [Methanococcus voltae]MBP2172240.1 putative membrane protein SpoIIM required for sporulation [Methanococcus voltae]MBP2200804.1 putative membrane protein SpoIIM required for sporulation [Methanococcus voltae]MCS3921528.1 putative membrane protein SpoIIM required for sporulation [Methanococcus voltae PS]